jgi:hypothetical protein
MRVLRALKRSPLALDLYTWLTYKAYVVSRSGVPQTVPWSGLMAQMGADYATLNDFRKKVTALCGRYRLFTLASRYRAQSTALPSYRRANPPYL